MAKLPSWKRFELDDLNPNMGFQVGPGGSVNMSGGMSLDDLYGIALLQDKYRANVLNRAREAVRTAGTREQMMARRGIDPRVLGLMAGQRKQMQAPKMTRHSVAEMLGQKEMNKIMQDRMAEEQRRIIAANRPSGFDKIAGFALPLLGMMAGGFGWIGPGGLQAASLGGTIGQTTAGLLQDY